MTNKIFTLLIGALSLTAYARPHHDDVFISACTDNYKFTTHGNTPVVENSTETEYTLNSAVNQKIQPGVYYGEFISLDYAKCGSCKAAYKSVTPENVTNCGANTRKPRQNSAARSRTYTTSRASIFPKTIW